MKIFLFVLIVFVLGMILLFIFKKPHTQNSPVEKHSTISIIKKSMNISSPAFANNQPIPDKYTCTGDNINPPLEFSHIPAQAKSLVLMVDDPDAPSGLWVHWTIFNMPPSITHIAENTKPETGTEGITSFGKPGYGAPCPPLGTHRYFFKLYALDTTLTL